MQKWQAVASFERQKNPHLVSAFFRFHCREEDQEGEEEEEDEKEGL